jgi:predicted S18 family serine protease
MKMRKTMSKFSGFQWYRAASATGFAIALVAGCASIPPPTEQMAVSKAAIANALSAGGSEYAAVEMKSAQDKLDSANRAMAKEDYENARSLAEQAQADARLAEKKAQAAKAQKAAGAMEDNLRVLREEMNRKSK